MLRSLYSGISGMKVNQTKMDVIGNNIANVGTTGYKTARVRFQDMLSQNVTEAMAPMANQGGVNASQVGLGVQLGSVDTIMKQGMMQPTSRNLDVAIDGDGFFMVGKGPSVFGDESLSVNHTAGMHNVETNSITRSGMELMYSREGSFTLDNDGNLLTSDGFRVLGYSVTNDNPLQDATSVSPIGVSTGGFDFRFGPGAALNEYKVVLGQVGPDTIASAEVDKDKKWIVLNGDFSGDGTITDKQVESAISKALNSAGVAQTVSVNGKNNIIPKVESTMIKGGADAAAPNSISVAGLTLGFAEGSELNGYSIQLGSVSQGTDTKAEVDTANKKITLSGDFVTPNAVSLTSIKNEINAALSAKDITQTINNISGSPITLADINTRTDNVGSVPELPQYFNGASTTKEATAKLGGLDITFTEGGQLNDYKVKLGTISTGTDISVSVDKASKTITVNGDFTTTTPTNGISSFMDELKTKFNGALASSEITQPKIDTITGTAVSAADSVFKFDTTGKDIASPSEIGIAGLNFSFNKGTTFNGYTVEIGKINSAEEGTVAAGEAVGKSVSQNVSAVLNKASKKIIINADFISPNAFTTSDIQTAINNALKVNTDGFGDPATDATGSAETSNEVKIQVTGSPKNYSSISSIPIDGGSKLDKPGEITVGGFTFNITGGEALNDYVFEIGKITEGTIPSADISTATKKVIINGDFVTPNALSPETIQTVVNMALKNKGINQAVSVVGSSMTVNDVVSSITTGGTPIQSMDTDGVVNFVDATKELKSYDSSLKTLRIPDKIRIKGEDRDLRVRTFTISKDGLINAVLEDGRVSTVGQLALAAFKNPAGLSKLGKNLYSQSVNSGEATIKTGIGTLNEDNSKGYGDSLQGMLEMSNVDLAEQFTDMIVTSRSFQASGKMITAGDEILQDIINLKR